MSFGNGKLSLYVLLCVFPAITKAAELSATSPNIAAENPISFSYALQILASFAAVIVFILVLAWFMRKSGRFGISGNKHIRMVSSLSLGMREKIVMVNVEGVNIVVGVAPGQIRTLYVLSGQAGDGQMDVEKDDDNFGPILGKLMK